MKTKSILSVCILLFLNSCIVKSLKPFYIPEAVEFQEMLVGEWTSAGEAHWKIAPFKEAFKEENQEVSEEDLEAYESYKNGYIIEYSDKNNRSAFLAMPFKIDQTILIDFIPIPFEEISLSIANQHLLKTHSVAKLDVLKDKKIKISWLVEENIKDLFNNHQVKIKHEKIGLEEDFLFTASSKELYAFIKKYCNSSIEDKWKSSQHFTLNKLDAKP